MVSNLLLTSSSIIFPLITFPYVTKTLSNDSMGRVFFIDAFSQYFIIFAALGIPFYGVREIAKLKDNEEQKSHLVIELVTLQFGLSVAYCLLFLILGLFIPKVEQSMDLVIIACITIITNSFMIEWFYQGIENYSYITKRSLIVKFLSVAAILLFVRNSEDSNIYYAIIAAVTVLSALLNYGNFLKSHYKKSAQSLNFKRHLRPLFVLFSINVSVSVYTILDTIILGLFATPVDVSYYNVPLKLVKIFWMVVSGAGTVLIPRIALLFVENDQSAIKALMTKSFSIVFLLTIPFSACCLFFPSEILIIISGTKYLAAVNALRILSIVPFIIGVCNVLGTQFLMPIGKERHILYATILGLVMSLSFNFLLIPSYKFIGTAIACVISEVAVCIYILVSAKKRISLKIDLPLILQIFISTVAAVAAGKLIHQNFALTTLAVSVIVYLFVFIILQFALFKNQFISSILKFQFRK